MTLASNNIPATVYNAILRSMYLRRNGVWLVLPFLACFAAGFIDVRFLIAGLLFLVVVMPMAVALIYYNYALVQESRWSILTKEIDFDDDKLMLRFSHERMRDVVLPYSGFESRTVSHSCLILFLDRRRYRFLAIPFSAFNGDDKLLRNILVLIDNAGELTLKHSVD